MRWLDLFRKRVAVLLSAGFILATASASFGAVTVTVNTDKVGGGVVYGAWSIDAGTTWNAGGATVAGAAGPGYTITFGDVPGYTKPADIATGALVDPQAYVTTGSYTAIVDPGQPALGVNAITVNILPAQAVTDGAQWSLDGGTTWRNDGDTVSGPSSYTITYKTTAGWKKPASVSGSTTTPTVTGIYRHVMSDFDKDATSDIVFRDNTTGHVYMWSNMNGGTVGAGGYTSTSPGVDSGVPGVIVGQGDFNGDGKSDLLFEDTSTNDLTVWIMNGTAVVSTSNLMTVTTPITRSATEIVAGVADFNGDGKDEILILEPVGATLQGRLISNVDWDNLTSTNLSHAISQSSTSYGAHTGWHVVALADFNADGKADIFWRLANQTDVGSWTAGQSTAWLMNGATRSSKVSNPKTLGAYSNSDGATPTGWQVAGTGDFNGDGFDDLLYRYAGGGSVTTGTLTVWLVQDATLAKIAKGNDDATPLSARGSGKAVDADGVRIDSGAYTATGGWHVIAIGDYDGDGKDDVLWRYMGTGHTYVWTMDGRTITSADFTSVYPGTADGTGWNAQIMRKVTEPQ